jgi:hypothetical protein
MLALRKYSLLLRSFIVGLEDKNRQLTLVVSGIFILFQILIIILLTKVNASLYLGGFIVILGMIQIFMRYPRIWIYTVVAGLLVYLTFESPEIDVIEILFGIFYLGGIISWFIWQSLIRKKKVIHNPGDWLIIFFITISSTNVIIASLNNVEPISWLREWNAMLLLLYYFPIRDYFSSSFHIEKLFFTNGVVVTGLCIYLIYKYYLIISKGVAYAYQYQAGGASTIEGVFMVATIFGVFSTIFATSGKKRLWAILFTGLTIGSLLITFRRTYWLTTIICILLAVPFLKIKFQRRLITYILFATGFVLISAFTVIGPRGSKLFFSIAAKRFESVSKGSRDISFYARYMESQEALQHIHEYPLSGSGMRSIIAFYEPILRHTKHNAFIHNGYIGSLHKLGIILTIILFLPFVYFIRIGFLNIRYSKRLPPLIQIIAFGSFFSLIGVFISNFTINQFTQRSSMFIMCFCISFTLIVQHYRKNFQNSSTSE